jgi:hypothetical protein
MIASLRLLAALALMLCGSLTGMASSVVRLTLEERAIRADRVVIAEVVSMKLESEEGPPARRFTRIRLRVRDNLKGPAAPELEVVQLGGADGAFSARIPGDAEFRPGELALLFLRCPAPDSCALLGFSEGKLAVIAGEGAESVILPDPSGKGARRTSLAEIERTIRSALAGPGASPAPGSEVSR